MTKVRIGIDIMGGDFAPNATIEGSVSRKPYSHTAIVKKTTKKKKQNS